MNSPDEVIGVTWNGAAFELYRDSENWHCNCSKDGAELYKGAGPDIPSMLVEAIRAAGFGEATKQEIFHALMSALREKLFN